MRIICGQLAGGQHRVDVGQPSRTISGRSASNFFAVQGMIADAEDASRVDAFLLGEVALDDRAQHLLRALAGGEVVDELRVELSPRT